MLSWSRGDTTSTNRRQSKQHKQRQNYTHTHTFMMENMHRVAQPIPGPGHSDVMQLQVNDTSRSTVHDHQQQAAPQTCPNNMAGGAGQAAVPIWRCRITHTHSPHPTNSPFPHKQYSVQALPCLLAHCTAPLGLWAQQVGWCLPRLDHSHIQHAALQATTLKHNGVA